MSDLAMILAYLGPAVAVALLAPTADGFAADMPPAMTGAILAFRLGFAYGRNVQILKTVAGAAELRHMLRVRLVQNPRG